MLGTRTPHDTALPAHADDWSADRLAAVHRRLDVAATTTGGADQVEALLDEVPTTPRNTAALLEHLVEAHARRARAEGRARDVVRAPLAAEPVAHVADLLVVRWLTRRRAMGRRVIQHVSHSPAATVAPAERTGWLLVRHLAGARTAPASA